MKELICQNLSQIEADYDVRILWAVESGSRSWGFESPDSDYDVRFLYVNRPNWYLSIEEGRDVIELPINDDLDISGWDLRKTLRLFNKSNPVLLEWLQEKDSIPPMSFVETVNNLDLPQQVSDSITSLLAKKKVTSELGNGPKIPILEEFIKARLEKAEAYCETAAVGNVSTDVLSELFREIIQESWSG
jgi:predicted nucleotidyltransferase